MGCGAVKGNHPPPRSGGPTDDHHDGKKIDQISNEERIPSTEDEEEEQPTFEASRIVRVDNRKDKIGGGASGGGCYISVSWEFAGTPSPDDIIAICREKSTEGDYENYETNSRCRTTGTVRIYTLPKPGSFVLRYYDSLKRTVVESEPFQLETTYKKQKVRGKLDMKEAKGKIIVAQWKILSGHEATTYDRVAICKKEERKLEEKQSLAEVDGNSCLYYEHNLNATNCGSIYVKHNLLGAGNGEGGEYILKYISAKSEVLFQSSPFMIR